MSGAEVNVEAESVGGEDGGEDSPETVLREDGRRSICTQYLLSKRSQVENDSGGPQLLRTQELSFLHLLGLDRKAFGDPVFAHLDPDWALRGPIFGITPSVETTEAIQGGVSARTRLVEKRT